MRFGLFEILMYIGECVSVCVRVFSLVTVFGLPLS